MSTITDDTGLDANKGKRGGPTVEVEAPSEDEIRQRCQVIRASWADPLLRLELGLSETHLNREQHV